MPRTLMLRPLLRRSDITEAEQIFQKTLAARATSNVKVSGIDVPTPGGTAEDVTLIFLTNSLWHLPTPRGQEKWWHPFGFDQPESLKTRKSSRMIVQFTRARSGYSAKLGAFFAADPNDTIYLVHTGKIGGGRKGVGKTAFLESLGPKAIPIELNRTDKTTRMSVAFCSAITSPNLVRDIEKFTEVVYQFKLPISDRKSSKNEAQAKFVSEAEVELSLKNLTDDQLRRRIVAGGKPKRTTTKIDQFLRNSAVVVLVKRRAEGVCERCEDPAPFRDRFMRPFLECHHITTLAEGGVDDETNAMALCPNCHREAHFSGEQPALRSELAKRLKKIIAREKISRKSARI